MEPMNFVIISNYYDGAEIVDPYLNLALDHAILLLNEPSRNEVLIRLWRNKHCVVVGKAQILEDEVNLDFCKRHGISVCRRISGGGAVYHDLGNLNVSLYMNWRLIGSNGLKSVQNLLSSILSISLEKHLSSEGNRFKVEDTSVFLGEKKISGSASYKHKTKFLYHFTILHDANLEYLESTLLAKNNKIKSRRSSNYAPTTNLSEFEQEPWLDAYLMTFANHFNKPLFAHYRTIETPEYQYAKTLRSMIYADQEWINEGKWAKFVNSIKFT